MRMRWLTLILFAAMSCSEGGSGNGSFPADNAFANSGSDNPPDRTPPSAQAIIAATDCRPPPCDDAGACARMPIAEVRELQCRVSPTGDTARCSFEMVPAFESREERARQTARVEFSLRRRDGADWCIGS
jgi:hypothetical protein